LSVSMNKLRRLGLLSDSHGNLDATEKAIDILMSQDCDQVIHLGDFCDTNRRDHTKDICRLFLQKKVIAVKGNNDYLIELSLSNLTGKEHTDQRWISEFLKEVPLNIVVNDICFAHSFPFNYLRAFYEPIDVGSTERALLLFGQMSHRILFCGHSHAPVFFHLRDLNQVDREVAPLRKKLSLDPASRYIFIVGSTDDGECAVFDAERSTYERINIRS
jgi:putative phosphoesterase